MAGCGDEFKACLLNGYQQTNTRPANAYLEIRMKLTVIEGDHIFRRPDSDHPYIKVDQPAANKKLLDSLTGSFTRSTFVCQCNGSLSLDESASLGNGSSSKATGTSAASALTVAGAAGDLHPPIMTMSGYGHSRQASKSSMCSNYSTSSVNSTNNSMGFEKMQPR